MTPWSARRTSTFSDSNLTPLESLVLECALENAQQQQGASKEAFEMSQEDYEELLKIPGNTSCCDCGKEERTEWCSVTFGIFLCAACSGVHRAMGTHISRVRSTKMDAWPEEHLERMRQGGNQACRDFLEEHCVDMEISSIQDIYTSSAAEFYKEILKNRTTPDNGDDDDDDNDCSSSFAADEDEAITPAPPARSSLDLGRSTSTVSSTGRSFEEEEEEEEELLPGEPTPKEEHQEEKVPEGETPHKDLLEETAELGQALQVGLERWFSKVKKDATDATSRLSMSIHSSSNHTRQKRGMPRRSLSVASAPTITYMGRSFSANSEEYKNLGSPHRERSSINSISSVKSLTDLALQQDEMAKNSTSETPWRNSLPPNFWTVDKKVEPFMSSPRGDATEKNSSKSHTPSSRRMVHDTVRQHLSFTEKDLLSVAMDDKEFARLKAGLKNRGAVTNEVLKQKLYAFIAKSKQRKSLAESKSSSITGNVPPRRAKSADMNHLGLAHTIHTSTMPCTAAAL